MKASSKVSLLVPLFLIPNSFINSNQESKDSRLEKITSQEIQSTSTNQNEKNLSYLINYMRGKNLAIDSLINDKRFRIDDSIVVRFTRSSERVSKNLDEYKKALKFDEKKKRIPEFIERNISTLKKAEQAYGIPKEVISAIFGIESNFGQGTGRHNPFNVYVSMYVKSYRQDFAKGQLEELLIFCKKKSIDVLDLKSSYAGAMTYAQFIPSSLNRWFVGRELYSIDDNIMSVANYLSHFKKITGSIEKSIYRYNPNNLYVEFVLDLAKGVKE